MRSSYSLAPTGPYIRRVEGAPGAKLPSAAELSGGLIRHLCWYAGFCTKWALLELDVQRFGPNGGRGYASDHDSGTAVQLYRGNLVPHPAFWESFAGALHANATRNTGTLPPRDAIVQAGAAIHERHLSEHHTRRRVPPRDRRRPDHAADGGRTAAERLIGGDTEYEVGLFEALVIVRQINHNFKRSGTRAYAVDLIRRLASLMVGGEQHEMYHGDTCVRVALSYLHPDAYPVLFAALEDCVDPDFACHCFQGSLVASLAGHPSVVGWLNVTIPKADLDHPGLIEAVERHRDGGVVLDRLHEERPEQFSAIAHVIRILESTAPHLVPGWTTELNNLLGDMHIVDTEPLPSVRFKDGGPLPSGDIVPLLLKVTVTSNDTAERMLAAGILVAACVDVAAFLADVAGDDRRPPRTRAFAMHASFRHRDRRYSSLYRGLCETSKFVAFTTASAWAYAGPTDWVPLRVETASPNTACALIRLASRSVTRHHTQDAEAAIRAGLNRRESNVRREAGRQLSRLRKLGYLP